MMYIYCTALYMTIYKKRHLTNLLRLVGSANPPHPINVYQ